MKENNLIWKNIKLKNETKNFIINNNHHLPAYSTNLEVINTIRYNEDDIISFINTIDKSNHIFHDRWGDAPIRYMISIMFWSAQYLIRLCDFDYQHSIWKPYAMCQDNSMNDSKHLFHLKNHV